MQRGRMKFLGATLVAPGLLMVSLLAGRGQGEEPSRLSRLFRFGGGSSSAAPTNPMRTRDLGAPPSTIPAPPQVSAPFVPPVAPAAPATNRIAPRPRVTRSVTDADPILTRVSLGRSSDGGQFGMFLQIFADGTVLDSEGEHHVGRDVLRPILDALQSGDLYRVKGHCGSPSTDFVEQVHVVVYERSLGRLRANAFSYSGNPQGCDHAVAHLHAALETLQTKLSRPAAAAASTGVVESAPPIPTTGQPTTIPLTPSP